MNTRRKKARYAGAGQGISPAAVRRARADAFTPYAGRLREGRGKTREQINAELRELRGE